jgi:hypothetical protein
MLRDGSGDLQVMLTRDTTGAGLVHRQPRRGAVPVRQPRQPRTGPLPGWGAGAGVVAGHPAGGGGVTVARGGAAQQVAVPRLRGQLVQRHHRRLRLPPAHRGRLPSCLLMCHFAAQGANTRDRARNRSSPTRGRSTQLTATHPRRRCPPPSAEGGGQPEGDPGAPPAARCKRSEDLRRLGPRGWWTAESGSNSWSGEAVHGGGLGQVCSGVAVVRHRGVWCAPAASPASRSSTRSGLRECRAIGYRTGYRAAPSLDPPGVQHRAQPRLAPT